MNRRCSRATCSGVAVATLTFDYSDSTAVVGPLALRTEPGSYDLCELHSDGLRVPNGWQVVRIAAPGPPRASAEDLDALAEAVRRAGLGEGRSEPDQLEVTRRKGHLAVVADLPQD